jgi:soluble lytic murein transglycosylase
LITLPPATAGRLDFQRGEALLEVGMRREALGAFDGVRSTAWDDPVALAQLAIYFQEKGFVGLAARAALRLASLWPGGNILTAPEALQKFAYPLAYTDLLSVEAQEQDLDPLLLAALVRQESLFEPVAESYAGARGLGQVMPATGQGIANNLGMEDFKLDDLYRPYVSLKFGAYYLAVQLGRFDNHILIALAAYNGGPGNTIRWLEAGGEDFDLFVEVITAAQSRLYLQRVYQHYLVYEALYRPSESTDQQ